jgi:hypothetical protein
LTKEEIEYAVIANAVDTLSILCAGDRDKIIDLLTGYLWDEEEASWIKKSSGKLVLTPNEPAALALPQSRGGAGC